MVALPDAAGIDVLRTMFSANCGLLRKGISLTAEPDCGRALRTRDCIVPNGHILSAPLELKVRRPTAPPDTTAETELVQVVVPELVASYKQVLQICHDSSSTFGVCFYWSAMTALVTADWPPLRQGDISCCDACAFDEQHMIGHATPDCKSLIPPRALPPPVSEEVQERILQLYRPDKISSKCPGREDNGQDAAALAIVQCFGLRCTSHKFEALVLAFKYNSFSHGDGDTLALFFAPSFCNHSCSPSCDWTHNDEGGFDLSAGSQGLDQGEDVSISYIVDDVLNASTKERREKLAGAWHFFCQCKRCALEVIPCCNICGGEHAVLLSGRDESPYGDNDVDCDGCGTKDLSLLHSYFFHCFQCDSDLCPECAFGVTGLAG